MFKPTQSHKRLEHQNILCSEGFTLLSWNVAKLSLSKKYQDYVNTLIQSEKIDILLLQEVKKEMKSELDLLDFSYIFSPNIQTKKHMYGVLTGFKIACNDDQFLLTKKQEVFYATHKVSLITKHQTSSGLVVLIVNLHAINFVNSKNFEKELQAIKSSIQGHVGPMVVAGDFNTWTKNRLQSLEDFRMSLSLKKVNFPDEKHLKKVFSKALDYIFYRDLELINAKVINSRKISDHNPLVASFRLF